MKGPDDGEQKQGGGEDVAGKQDGEAGEAHHKHLLSWKGIDEVSAEGSEEHGHDGVARQHSPYHILGCPEMFAEVDGQERCEEVEGEKEREICYHHLAIVLIPKSFHDVVGKNTAKLRKKF